MSVPSRISWRNPLIAAYLLGLVPAVATALLQPVWSLVDESDHYDLVAQYAHGIYPNPDSRPTIMPETLRVTETSGTFGYFPAGTVPRPSISSTFDTEPPGLDRVQHNLWVERHFWQYSKEASQPPLFYAVAVPVFGVGDAIAGPMGALRSMRLFNALLAALLVPIAYVLGRRLWPGGRFVAVGGALFTALLAGPVLDLTHVTNDTLAALLVAACLLVATGDTASGLTARRATVLGLLFGAACLTRVTDAAIAPALMIPIWLRSPARARVSNAVLFAVTGGVIVTAWLLTNVVRFGTATRLNSTAAWWPAPPPTADPTFWALSTIRLFSSFPVDVPYGVLPSAPWLGIALAATLLLSVIGALLAVFAAVGLWRAARARQSNISKPTLAVLGTATAGITAAAVVSPLLIHVAIQVPGRYLYPALPAIAALLVAGLVVELKPAVTQAAVASLAVLSVVVLAVFLAQPLSGPQGPGHPVGAASQLRSDQGSFGPLTVTVEECAGDRSTGTWVQVTAVNSSDGPLDWMPAPVVSANGTILATSDYRRSTQLPGTVVAGDSVTGWLWLGDHATLGGTRSATLTFPGVAYDSYHQVGDLQVVTELC
jgi:hypothetical protein